MMHTDLFFDKPDIEPTDSERLAAQRLDIPVEAMTYIIQVWEQAAFETLSHVRPPRPGREGE